MQKLSSPPARLEGIPCVHTRDQSPLATNIRLNETKHYRGRFSLLPAVHYCPNAKHCFAGEGLQCLVSPRELRSGCSEGIPEFQGLSPEQSDARPRQNRGVKPDKWALLRLHSDIKDSIFPFKGRDGFPDEDVVLCYRNAPKGFCEQSPQ